MCMTLTWTCFGGSVSGSDKLTVNARSIAFCLYMCTQPCLVLVYSVIDVAVTNTGQSLNEMLLWIIWVFCSFQQPIKRSCISVVAFKFFSHLSGHPSFQQMKILNQNLIFFTQLLNVVFMFTITNTTVTLCSLLYRICELK